MPEKWHVITDTLIVFVTYLHPHTSYLHLARSEVWCWSEGRGILTELPLCYRTICHSTSLLHLLFTSLHSIIIRHSNRYLISLLHSLLYTLTSWAWWDWPLTWLANHCPQCYHTVGWVIWSITSPPKWPIMC